MRPKLFDKLNLPLVLASLIFVGIFLLLGLQPGAAKVSQALIHRGASGVALHPYPLRMTAQDSAWSHELDLKLVSPRVPSEFSLVIATHRKSLGLLKSEVTSGSCVWQLEAQATIEDNSTVTWSKFSDCQMDPESRLLLKIVVKDPGEMAAWATNLVEFRAPADEPAVLVTADAAKPKVLYALIGSLQFPVPKPEASKLTLLAAMWGQDATPWLAWRLSLGLGFVLMAAWLPRRLLYPVLWLGLATIQATTTPPFQAPDEPDHFLSYANLIGDSALAANGLKLANIGQLSRIKFHPGEKFTSQDIGQPLANQYWDDHIAGPDVRQRSPVTALAWALIQKMIGKSDAATTLWSVRFCQILIVVMIFAFCTYSCSSDSVDLMGLMTCCAALPLFAFHISNYFTSVALGLIPCFVLSDVLLDAKLRPLGLWAYAFAVGLLPYSSAMGIGAMILFAVITPLVLLQYTNGNQKKWGWSDALSVLAAIVLLLLPHLIFDTEVKAKALAFVTALLKLENIGYSYPQYASLVVAGMFVVILLPAALIAKFRKLLQIKTQRLAQLCLLGWISVWLWSLIKPLEFLPDIEKPEVVISKLKYVAKVIVFFATSLLPGRPDFYISSSFWSGFGWLEVTMHYGLIALICLPTMLGIALYLLQSASKQYDRTFFKFSFCMMALVLMLGFLASDRWESRINLHGRYLIMTYLGLMTIAFAGWQIFCRERFMHPRWDRIWPSVALVTHLFALNFILNRYF